MDRKEEIKKLQAQREEINRRIRYLKDDGMITIGRAKIARQHTYAYRADELWSLSYSVPLKTHMAKPAAQFKTLCSGTRKECVEFIPKIIEDLRMLYETAVMEGVPSK